MKLVLRTIMFHMLCILVFSMLYRKENYIDSVSQSVTIQAGVGIIREEEMDERTKKCMIVQQLVLISTHVITLYIFTV